jgi:hypothetical protein
MARRRSRVLVLGSTLALVATLQYGPIGAGALSTSDNVTFSGVAVVTSDSDGDSSSEPAVDLIGGNGSFTFASTGCGYVSADGPEAGLCLAQLTGTYTATVCGVFRIAASGRLTSPRENGTYNLSVLVVGGVGVITGTLIDADDGSLDDVRGLAVITPTPITPAVDDPEDCTRDLVATFDTVATDP